MYLILTNSEVYFKNKDSEEHLSVREVKAENIGRLITVKGIVTRCTEVKPMLVVATYTCDQCSSETYQPVSDIEIKNIGFLFYLFITYSVDHPKNICHYYFLNIKLHSKIQKKYILKKITFEILIPQHISKGVYY